jgi:acyl-CoA synthetase (AMP-forming)/AMP-acid ligase II
VTGTGIDGVGMWQLVERRAEATPDAPMFVETGGAQITFGELRESAARVAAGFAERGVGTDDVVSWLLPTSIDAFVAMAALARLGAVQNPLIPIYRYREVSFIVAQAGSRLLLVPREWRGFDYASMAEEVARGAAVELVVIDAASRLPESDPAELSPPPAPLPPHEQPVRWLFYTSGTTADPKGVRHTDASIIAAARGLVGTYGISAADRQAIAFPVAHIGGVIWLAGGLMTGFTQLLVESFDPATTIPAMRDFGVTLAGSGTAFHLAYLDAQRRDPLAPLFPAVRAFPGGAAPKPATLHETMKRELGGGGIVSSYGLTEAPILSCASVDDPDDKLAATEGRLTPGVVARVVDLDGNEVEPGEEGELRVRAPQLFRGYVDSALDEDAFDDQGWFRTGDLARVDAGGYVTITGRLKDVIIRKGETISASEVEDALFRHPGVRDVAVVGIADDASGERVCAAVVPADPSSPLRFDEMAEFLRAQRLMVQKIPEQLEILDELPRNSMGKVLKQELRKRFAPRSA